MTACPSWYRRYNNPKCSCAKTQVSQLRCIFQLLDDAVPGDLKVSDRWVKILPS
ncbi:hypothetical protein BGW80DRAFT_1291639 [Lactifluus volemus]|nr:hypothetical protein BGW80DRAFT_1291639 [Lactifluus volemus]